MARSSSAATSDSNWLPSWIVVSLASAVAFPASASASSFSEEAGVSSLSGSLLRLRLAIVCSKVVKALTAVPLRDAPKPLKTLLTDCLTEETTPPAFGTTGSGVGVLIWATSMDGPMNAVGAVFVGVESSSSGGGADMAAMTLSAEPAARIPPMSMSSGNVSPKGFGSEGELSGGCDDGRWDGGDWEREGPAGLGLPVAAERLLRRLFG